MFAITRGELGGAQEHVRILAEGLAAKGHAVAAVVESPSPLGDRLAAKGVEVLPWRSIKRNPNLSGDWKARRELDRAVTNFRPEVLHLHSAKAGVLGRGLLTPPSGVTVLTCHHAPFGPGRRMTHRLVSRPIEQLTLRLLDGIISVGARDIPLLRKLAPGIPISLVPNAVPPVSTEMRTDWPTRAAWVARLAHPKDPLQAVEAWRVVAQRHPDARFDICGTGPLLDRTAARVEAVGLDTQVNVKGRVPDVAPVLQNSSIFVLATQVEGGTTMATLEAMSAGLVPVISDAGDAFLYTHADCGIVVARNSPKAMGRAIADLFDDPSRLQRMSRAAFEFATARWTTEDMVEATIRSYDRFLGR